MKGNQREVKADSPEYQYSIGIDLYQKQALDEALAWLEKAADCTKIPDKENYCKIKKENAI